MKKINKSDQSPLHLKDYQELNPHADWDEFKNNDRDGYAEVKNNLKNDQRGLCAYCEIQMAEFNGHGLDDFRVEHFHPKKPHNPPPNLSLEWSNLLAVCTGGNAKSIGSKPLFTSPDHSCDVPKENKNLVGVILNPQTDIPPFPPIFEFDEQGEMSVGVLCPAPLKGKAQASIDELRLSPSPDKVAINPRLKRFRKEVIETLNEQLIRLVQQDKELDTAAAELAEIYFRNEESSQWPSFFSSIRWYLGPAAENRLHAIDYNG